MSKLNRKHTTPREKREILQKLEQGESAARLAEVYGIGRSTIFDMKKQSDRVRAKIQTNCQTVQRNLTQPNTTSTSTKRHERKTLTLSEKSAILYRLDQGESGNMLATIFGIAKSTISDIKKKSEKIRGFISSSSHGPGTRKTLRKAKNPRVEKALYMWIGQETYKGVPVSGDILANKAKYFYERITGNTDFIASNGWVERFKIRHGIKLSHLASDKSSSVKSAVQKFHHRLEQIVTGLVLTPNQIYLVNESCVAHQITLAQNSPLSFMVCANSTGEHKLKMTVIGSAECLVKDCASVNFVEQANAWITRNILLKWFHEDFVPETRAWLRENNIPGRALLLLPSAPGYPSEEELETDDKFIRTLFIPPNCKTLLQPIEQHVMQRIRTRYKIDLLNKLQSQNNISTISPTIDIKEVLQILTNTWNTISPSLITFSCRNILSTCCDPLLDLNSPSYEDIVKEGQAETTKILIESVAENYGMTTEQITIWFKSDNDKSSCHEMRTDSEIIEYILNENETKPDSVISSISCEVKVDDHEEVFTNSEHTLHDETDLNTENVNVKSNTVLIKCEDNISHQDAVNAFDVCVKWAGENNISAHELLLLRQMKTQAVHAANMEEFS